MTTPSTKPIGYLIVLPKEAREAIIAWFESQKGFGIRRYEMDLPQVGKVYMTTSPDGGAYINFRYRTQAEAEAYCTNVTLFRFDKADPRDFIPKYETKLVDDGTLAKLNPEWLNAPWSVEMVFAPQEEGPLEKFLAEDREYEGRMAWVNHNSTTFKSL